MDCISHSVHGRILAGTTDKATLPATFEAQLLADPSYADGILFPSARRCRRAHVVSPKPLLTEWNIAAFKRVNRRQTARAR